MPESNGRSLPRPRLDPTAALMLGRQASPYHVLLGTTERRSPQWAVLGQAPGLDGKIVAIDLDRPSTVLLLGVQGSGKTTVLQLIAESSCMPIPGLNALPAPRCVVAFHYSLDPTERPELMAMGRLNAHASDGDRLRREYGAVPQGIEDLLVLVPGRRLAERRAECGPGVRVEALCLSLDQLSVMDIQTLLGVIGDEAPAMQALSLLLERRFASLTLEGLRQAIQGHRGLSDGERRVATLRLEILDRFLGTGVSVREHVRPGRLIIVDLRDATLSTVSAFRLLVVLVRVIGQVLDAEGIPIPKTIVFNEFHRYTDLPLLLAALETNVRLMRHYNTAVLIDAQTPSSIPAGILSLSSLIICTRLVSPVDLRVLATANHAFAALGVHQTRGLLPGQGWCWSQDCFEALPTQQPIRIDFRPPVSSLGGRTATAVKRRQP